jgi:cytochrome P450
MLMTYNWLRRPFEFMEDCAERFGDPFTFRLPALPPLVVYSNPEVVKKVFAEPGESLHAGRFNRSLSAFLGDKSVLMVDGPSHIRKRRLLMPPFHGERMTAYGKVMLEIANEAIDAFPAGRAFSLHEPMNDVALNIIVRNVFGIDPGPREATMRGLLRELLDIMTWPPLLMPAMQIDLGPLSPWGKALRKRREFDAVLHEEIRARRAAGTAGRDDILSLLIDARDEDGSQMGDDELRDELLTLLVAGHETTATALAWAFRWILATPSLEDRLRREIAEAAGVPADGRSPLPPLSAHKIAALPLIDATAREALRLQPVVPIVGRFLEAPMSLGGWDLPAGCVVICSIYLAHRRPESYPDPTRFDPDRFLGKKLTPAEFFPFGGGIRRCIGMAFALYEMKMVMTEILRRTKLVLEPSAPIRAVRRSITLTPSEGLRVRAVERSRSTVGHAA